MSPKLATVSRVSQLCVLCGMSYTGQGEHVETKSILKLWDNQGGITSMVGGTAATARNGSPYWEDRIRPTLLPVCPAPGCNDWLNVQFEHPGQHLVKDVLLENIHIRIGGGVVQFSKWWMKTFSTQTPRCEVNLRCEGADFGPGASIDWTGSMGCGP